MIWTGPNITLFQRIAGDAIQTVNVQVAGCFVIATRDLKCFRRVEESNTPMVISSV